MMIQEPLPEVTQTVRYFNTSPISEIIPKKDVTEFRGRHLDNYLRSIMHPLGICQVKKAQIIENKGS